ncbi:uncharacterized protein LOC131945857 [Physella acuta]|uniref:uncharacterized protein LOC131945857 n=1 Tax=Physella acuta TaxID=109671 RepID=UPI0027DC71B3|nr:uncharacterized protein LOC131945857 [Physella acuta]
MVFPDIDECKDEPYLCEQECYSACRAEHCYSFKFADGLCTIKLYVGDVVDVTQNIVAGSIISCYNDNSQCTLKSDVDNNVPVTEQGHEACFTFCLEDPDCIGYHYFPNILCVHTYTAGDTVDINNFPVDTFVYLDCDECECYWFIFYLL